MQPPAHSIAANSKRVAECFAMFIVAPFSLSRYSGRGE
jgi:hypothetical protein